MAGSQTRSQHAKVLPRHVPWDTYGGTLDQSFNLGRTIGPSQKEGERRRMAETDDKADMMRARFNGTGAWIYGAFALNHGSYSGMSSSLPWYRFMCASPGPPTDSGSEAAVIAGADTQCARTEGLKAHTWATRRNGRITSCCTILVGLARTRSMSWYVLRRSSNSPFTPSATPAAVYQVWRHYCTGLRGRRADDGQEIANRPSRTGGEGPYWLDIDYVIVELPM